ncbi:DUF6507 family protein [Streptomyces erythrochromogenes]|uniref:DUF6507 family protein n=1 Tax=Streptomyces erythrochromogenes TaxID=285574 RepID=UPI0038237E0B
MSTWDIKPAGVQGVLNKTAGASSTFEEEFTSYSDGLVGAATWAGTMVLGGPSCPRRARSALWPRRCLSFSSERKTT